MKQHGIPRNTICPYCFRAFGDQNTADAHIEAKHKHRSRSQQTTAQITMQKYHQDRISTQRMKKCPSP